jgi:hypothetical protein
LIFNREKQVFEIAAAVGAEPPDKVTLGPGEGIAGRVYLAENAELVNKVAADPRFKPEVFHFLHHLRSSEGRV